MEGEIKQSLQDFVDGGTVDYSLSPTDKIDNPASVSAFFLRNINKKAQQHPAPETISGCSNRPELSANRAILDWWEGEGCDFHMLDIQDPGSDNVDTLANCIVRSDHGATFLLQEVKRLRGKISAGQNGHDVYAAISSFYEKVENFTLAIMHLETAIEKAHGTDICNQYEWQMRRLKLCLRVRDEQEEVLTRINFSSTSQLSAPSKNQIPRVTVDDLSFTDFFHQYAMPGSPVILTGLGTRIVEELWTVQHVRQVADSCQGTVTKMVPQSVCAGRLEDVGESTVSEFLDTCGDNGDKRRSCLITGFSDELAERLTIPKYFAGDLLQRTDQDVHCRDSGPKLQISPEGFKVSLQTQQNCLHTWCTLMHGRQRWLVYRRDDFSMLYPMYEDPGTTVPVFNADISHPDMKSHPLLSETKPMECVLEPGDVIFIPAGCPYQTESLDVSVSISGHYMDLSNRNMVIQDLDLAALVDSHSADLLRQLTGAKFQSNMKSSVEHTSYKQYRTWPPDDYDMYDLTPDTVC